MFPVVSDNKVIAEGFQPEMITPVIGGEYF